MIKNAIIYRISESWSPDLPALEAALAKSPFAACGATQERSAGWVPPRGEEHGLLAESVAGQWVMRFMTEAKVLPASVLNRRVEEKADAIEKSEGRRPGKKEKKDLKNEAVLDLLPTSHTKISSMWVWINPAARLLMVGTGTQARADVVTSMLVQLLPGFALALLDTQTAPQAAMGQWLYDQEAPAGFSIDRACELRATDESKAVVRYGSHPLDIREVREHIKQGKRPTRLALTYDDRVSFVLNQALQIRGIQMLDSATDGRAQDVDAFDADVALATGELARLIPALVDALGGEGRQELGRGLAPHNPNAVTGPATAPTDTAPNESPF